MNSKFIPLKKAILWIFSSIIFISGPIFLLFLHFQNLKELRLHDSKYHINAIVQTSPGKESLRTVYLAELLNLSIDKPTNLFRFNTQEAKEKLEKFPLIKKATIKKINPGTLFVDYVLRNPAAFLADYTNTAIDEEGYAFPFNPFFTPKKLPKLIVGELKDSEPWGKKMAGKNFELAMILLNKLQRLCKDRGCYLHSLDVSLAFSTSYGERQIVVVLEDYQEKDQFSTQSWILRLSTKEISQQLANFLVLRNSMQDSLHKTYIIDLRIPQLAFIMP